MYAVHDGSLVHASCPVPTDQNRLCKISAKSSNYIKIYKSWRSSLLPHKKIDHNKAYETPKKLEHPGNQNCHSHRIRQFGFKQINPLIWFVWMNNLKLLYILKQFS